MLDLICMGEALVDFLPRERGRIREVRGFEVCSGGAPANVAIGAARLGATVGFAGVVGDDEFGHFLRGSLEVEGVDCSGLRHTREAKTGLSFVALDHTGERSFDFYSKPSADMLIAGEDAREEVLSRGRMLHYGSNSLVLAGGVDAARRLVRFGREAGKLISFDPNLRLHLWSDLALLRSLCEELGAGSDLVKCASEEAPFLTGTADPFEAARELVQRGATLAVVTRGPEGAVWHRRDGASGEAPAPVVDAIDTTGAGDGFMAGLLRRLADELRGGATLLTLEPKRIDEHLSFACRVGAAVVTRLGAVAGLPRAGDPLPEP